MYSFLILLSMLYFVRCFAFFTKGNNLYDFLFASFCIETFPTEGLLINFMN